MKITVDATLCVDRMVLSLQVAEQYQAALYACACTPMGMKVGRNVIELYGRLDYVEQESREEQFPVHLL